ncbi:MAG: FtsX-like permease family protein, partial [Anaerolineae bacterium]
GQASDPDGSRERTTASWVVTGIGTQRGVTGEGTNEGIIVDLAAARERFGLGSAAERIVVGFDTSLYDSSDPQRSSFNARDVAAAVVSALGDTDYRLSMPRPQAVANGAGAFIFFQSLVAMYGLLSLGVVGLLIRTLIMTNVQEQTRDMAILRILGAPRRALFNIVMAEVAVLGVLGVGLGIAVGQAVNNLVIVPFIQRQAAGIQVELPLVTTSGALLAAGVAAVVLVVSALSPARRAAGTKVTHAINPGVAEGIGLDDLAKMRERHVDWRVPGVGLVVLIFPTLIFVAFPLAFDFGVLWAMAALIFGALLAMIVGAALVFFVGILPFERLLLAVDQAVVPKAGYFTRRTVLRGKARNTLIALMIVLSATLPSFLSTGLALDVANTTTDRRLRGGAPIRVSAPPDPSAAASFDPETGEFSRPRATFRPELLDQVRADPGFGQAAALTTSYRTVARDGLGLKETTVRVVGVDADLGPILYGDAVEFTSGDTQALAEVVERPGAAIVAAGLETFFDRGVGGTLVLDGNGRDHTVRLQVVGVARRMGGVGVFSAKQTRVQAGSSTILVGIDTYRDLTSDPTEGPPDPRRPVMAALLATPAKGVDEADLTADLRLRYATEHDLGIDSTAETIRIVLEESRTGQLFLMVLTVLTSVIAVFGVFAVIYVSVYGRRGEIGLLKAIGASGRHLLAVFVGEAMVMTLSATLTGVVAGVLLAYVLRLSEGFRQEIPTVFALDELIVGAQLALMLLSSFVSAVVATHSFRRLRAVEILRTL